MSASSQKKWSKTGPLIHSFMFLLSEFGILWKSLGTLKILSYVFDHVLIQRFSSVSYTVSHLPSFSCSPQQKKREPWEIANPKAPHFPRTWRFDSRQFLSFVKHQRQSFLLFFPKAPWGYGPKIMTKIVESRLGTASKENSLSFVTE